MQCPTKKAKVWCMENLTTEKVFWLKDFCQNILPLQFRKGQHDYFGKKRQSLHTDVFFTKKDEELHKHVYFTAIHCCGQGVDDVLFLASGSLHQFKKDEPQISSSYVKSGNASWYHGNFCAEGLFKVCQENNFQLLRYGYNEPCKGKDQCDCESAGAKLIMQSYVDAGNNIFSAVDVKDALLYGKGLKNTKVGVAEIDKENASLERGTIPNISQYCS